MVRGHCELAAEQHPGLAIAQRSANATRAEGNALRCQGQTSEGRDQRQRHGERGRAVATGDAARDVEPQSESTASEQRTTHRRDGRRTRGADTDIEQAPGERGFGRVIETELDRVAEDRRVAQRVPTQARWAASAPTLANAKIVNVGNSVTWCSLHSGIQVELYLVLNSESLTTSSMAKPGAFGPGILFLVIASVF